MRAANERAATRLLAALLLALCLPSARGAETIELSNSSDDDAIAELDELPKLSSPAPQQRLRLSGWADMGYTAATSATGPLAVAPQMNHFGDEFLLNQLAITAERPVDPDELSFGYYTQLFGGADAYDLQGPGDIQSVNDHFGFTIRQANLRAHLPVFTARGMDVVVGRQGSLMGYESYMAPMRTLYSVSYQWWYAEDGADTGTWATVHATDEWDLTGGVTFGSNTFFELRGTAPCYIVQARQWFDRQRSLYQCATLVIGDQSIGKTSVIEPGKLTTVCEYRIQFAATERWTQVFQANGGWDSQVKYIGFGQWYGVLEASIVKLTDELDAQLRLEWFDDANGVRTGFATDYVSMTPGFIVHLGPQMSVRPEFRADFAGRRVFGRFESLSRQRSQFTPAVECVFTF
ncbi:MAG TPA: outer membrane beta-barrel protein [Pirellulales bacterium]|nr:outer membrane beta-barrel protein [Pirellulales bacterium]